MALQNASTFLLTNGIGALINFLGKLTIIVTNVVVAWFMLKLPQFSDVDNPYVPLAVVAFMSFAMATIFIDVYQTVSLTILQCLFTDVSFCKQENKNWRNNKFRPAEMNEVIEILGVPSDETELAKK